METKITEIRRYITLEFKEQDLLILQKEIDDIIPKIDSYNESYKGRDDKVSMEKLKEFRSVVNDSIIKIKEPVDYNIGQESECDKMLRKYDQRE